MLSFYREVVSCLQAGNAMLVSIISESGSAPRGIGAKMLVRPDGTTAGTIGGGAVEHAADTIGLQALEERRSFVQEFHLSPGQASDLGMVCGGTILVYFQFLDGADPAHEQLFETVLGCIGDNRPCGLITVIDGEDKAATYLVGENLPAPPVDGLPSLSSLPRLVEQNGLRYVLEPLVIGERVLIFGAGHVGKQLTKVLDWMGFYTVALDDRADFLTQENLPHAGQRQLVDLTSCMEELHVTSKDYVVIMTRGHLHDYGVLAASLKTPARYIGMIGSRAKIATTNKKLQADGFSPLDIARVHAPIGIPLGGKTPEEVALSVAAELVRVRSGYQQA